MSDARADLFPHVYGWQWPIIDRFGEALVNTGGNLPERLLNDLQNPGTAERPNRLASTNIVVFSMAMAVQSQVGLLANLLRDGAFRELAEKEVRDGA